MNIDEYINLNKIICPACKSSNLKGYGEMQEGKITCNDCGAEYSLRNDLGFLLNQDSSKVDIQEFWGELYKAAYSNHENITDAEEFKKDLDKLEQLFITKNHLAVNEMPIENLSGKKVLEIGPGAGAHSSLFAYKGAKMTAVDITPDRAVSTSRKLKLLSDEKEHFVFNADSESLPFEDNSFDIVYSNGVLHHTNDTEKAISEVYRVLKPGGSAVIMLYAKHSYLYWVNLFLLKGLFLGYFFKGKNWLGAATEWMSDEKQKVLNPITRAYSHRQLENIFCEFKELEIRKAGFNFDQIPIIGKIISRLVSKSTGYNESGYLIYDKAWRNDTKLELWLSKFIGFSNNIRATK